MIASVIVESSLSVGLDLLPLRQSKAALSSVKEILHLNQPIIAPYDLSLFSASKLVSRLYITVASWAIPPLVMITSAKEPCST